MWFVLSKPSIFWEICFKKKTILGCPPEYFTIYVKLYVHVHLPLVYIAKPLCALSMWFGVVFWMLHFQKDWWKLIQIHQYYTMPLRFLPDFRPFTPSAWCGKYLVFFWSSIPLFQITSPFYHPVQTGSRLAGKVPLGGTFPGNHIVWTLAGTSPGVPTKHVGFRGRKSTLGS